MLTSQGNLVSNFKGRVTAAQGLFVGLLAGVLVPTRGSPFPIGPSTGTSSRTVDPWNIGPVRLASNVAGVPSGTMLRLAGLGEGDAGTCLPAASPTDVLVAQVVEDVPPGELLARALVIAPVRGDGAAIAGAYTAGNRYSNTQGLVTSVTGGPVPAGFVRAAKTVVTGVLGAGLRLNLTFERGAPALAFTAAQFVGADERLEIDLPLLGPDEVFGLTPDAAEDVDSYTAYYDVPLTAFPGPLTFFRLTVPPSAVPTTTTIPGPAAGFTRVFAGPGVAGLTDEGVYGGFGFIGNVGSNVVPYTISVERPASSLAVLLDDGDIAANSFDSRVFPPINLKQGDDLVIITGANTDETAGDITIFLALMDIPEAP